MYSRPEVIAEDDSYEALNAKLHFKIVFTMSDKCSDRYRVAGAQACQFFGDAVLQTWSACSHLFSNAFAAVKPIAHYAPCSKEAQAYHPITNSHPRLSPYAAHKSK